MIRLRLATKATGQDGRRQRCRCGHLRLRDAVCRAHPLSAVSQWQSDRGSASHSLWIHTVTPGNGSVYSRIQVLLTGFIPSASWSEPRIQIWLGVIGNLIASLWVLQSKPFRSKLCNAAALTALLQLLVTYVSAFLFLRNPAAAGPRIDLNSWAGSLLVAINCACFAVMAGGSSRDIWRERQLAKARRLRYSADGAEVDPPPISPDEFHLFLSHTWAQGEEAMRTIKLRLTDMIPGAKVFLDKDDLKHGAGAEYIVKSKTVPVFCTAKY